MTDSFPFALTEFWQQLRFSERPEFQLMHYGQESATADGRSIPAKFGEPKWRCTVALANGRHDANLRVQARIDALLGRNGTFLAYDLRRPYPLRDPFGAAVAASSPTIASIGSDNRSFAITGLPFGYSLSAADFVSVGSGAGNKGLFKLIEGGDANGDGVTAKLQVQPLLPTWIAVGQTVTLIKPTAKFKIERGSYRPQSGQGNMAVGPSFTMIST